MLLRNFDFSTKYFDCKSRTELEKVSNFQINGWYKIINGILSALLVEDNKLFFLYGEREILITKSHRVLLERKNNGKCEFLLIEGNDVLVRFLYSLPDSKLNFAPFEYIDEDDFDWGDFVSKIVNNEEQRMNFIKNLMEQ